MENSKVFANFFTTNDLSFEQFVLSGRSTTQFLIKSERSLKVAENLTFLFALNFFVEANAVFCFF